MKRNVRLLFGLVLLGVTFVSQAQASPPSWVTEDGRERAYPAQEWYVGFAHDLLGARANAADRQKAKENLARQAESSLAKSITVTIVATDQMKDTVSQRLSGGGFSDSIITDYVQTVQTSTKVKNIPGMVSLSYDDPKARELYALAAVRRTDFANFLPTQIKMDLDEAEAALAAAERLKSAGEKARARGKIEAAKQLLDEARSYHFVLAALNIGMGRKPENGFQDQRLKNLQRKTDQLLTVNMDVVVYMECKHTLKNNRNDAFKKDPRILCGIIAQALSENNCRTTNNKSESDYVLTLVTSTAQRSASSGVLSYYANVEGALYNRAAKARVVEFSIINDADAYAAGPNPEIAGTKAFNRYSTQPALKSKVLEKVLSEIKN